MRLFFLSLLVGLFALTGSADASQPYSAKAFRDAQAAGKTILIDVAAPWCPVCRRQAPIIQSIAKERPALVVLKVDFDSEKETLKQLRVTQQSTLLVFRGTKEVGRSTGDSNPDSIRALVAKGF